MLKPVKKASPTIGDVHVDRPLTDVSTAYVQDEARFVAPQVFPTIPVNHKSDLYYTYSKEDWLRRQSAKRAPATESKGTSREIGTDNYVADVWALHEDVDGQTEANQDPAIDMEADATAFVTHNLLMERENEWVQNFFIPGAWGNEGTPSTLWDVASSTPIVDIKQQKGNILRRTGFEPNVLVLGWDVWNALTEHPDIIDRIKGGATTGQPAIATRNLMAQLFEVDRIVVASAVETKTAAGAATQTVDFIAGKHALLAFSQPSPGLRRPTAGYIFAWRFVGASIAGVRTRRIPMPTLGEGARRVEVELAFDMKKVADDLAFLFTNAVS